MKEFVARKSLFSLARKNPVLVLGYLTIAVSPLIWAESLDKFEKILAPIVSFSLFALVFIGIGFELFYHFTQPEKLMAYKLEDGKITYKTKSGVHKTEDLKRFQSLYLVSEYRRPAALVFSREPYKPQHYKSKFALFSFKTATLEAGIEPIEFQIELINHTLQDQLDAIMIHGPHLTDGRYIKRPALLYRFGFGTLIQ